MYERLQRPSATYSGRRLEESKKTRAHAVISDVRQAEKVIWMPCPNEANPWYSAPKGLQGLAVPLIFATSMEHGRLCRFLVFGKSRDAAILGLVPKTLGAHIYTLYRTRGKIKL